VLLGGGSWLLAVGVMSPVAGPLSHATARACTSRGTTGLLAVISGLLEFRNVKLFQGHSMVPVFFFYYA